MSDFARKHLLWILIVVSGFLIIERVSPEFDFLGTKAAPLRTLPSFSYPLITAEDQGRPMVSFDDFRGRPVIINFWASWCTICRTEKELLAKLHQEATDRGAAMLGLATYDSEADLLKSKLLSSIPYPVLLDELGDTALAMRVRGLPQTILVDANGQVLAEVRGPLTIADVEALIRTLDELREVAATVVKGSQG